MCHEVELLRLLLLPHKLLPPYLNSTPSYGLIDTNMLAMLSRAMPSKLGPLPKSIVSPSHLKRRTFGGSYVMSSFTQTNISIQDPRFLQLLLSVSLVPNSKYQSLLRILELNFSGYFSRITWKRCAIEASTPMEK